MSEVRDDSRKRSPELKAVRLSLLFLLFGFGVIWFMKAVVRLEGDAVYVSILLTPILVYAIFSGRLKEFKAPGGLEARFSEAATEPVTAAAEKIEPSVEEMQVVAKGGVRELQRIQHHLDEARPIIMTLVLGRGHYYDREALLQYVSSLSQYRNFKFVVFVDDQGRFVAYMPSWAFKGLLNRPELADEFISAVNQGRVQDLFRYPGVVRETISTRATNAEALREMTRQNLEALVVVDENRHLKGVVEREQVLSRMMLALAK